MSPDYTFQGWLGHSAIAAEGKMEWGPFEPKQWQEDDVDIQITHCAICGTDIHMLRSDWGEVPYPCCVGHEIVGKAVRVGARVKHIKVGDRVGVGAQARSCLQPDCPECSTGRENYCSASVSTYGSVYPNGEGKSYGGYANYNRTNGHFVIKIPDGLPSEAAAPMLCAGSTVYTPLKKHGCGPGKRVGVVGIGGLGHFAILFAKAFEAESVVAFSRASSKRNDALALGANEYVATSEDRDWTTKRTRSLDLIICTTSSPNMSLTPYLSLLKAGGTFVQLATNAGGDFPPISGLTVIFNNLKIEGSIIGTPGEIREMLDFAAEKNVRPWVQTRDMQDANQAILDLENGIPRYRFVLVNNS